MEFSRSISLSKKMHSNFDRTRFKALGQDIEISIIIVDKRKNVIIPIEQSAAYLEVSSEKMAREREIFLRAALQLLDEGPSGSRLPPFTTSLVDSNGIQGVKKMTGEDFLRFGVLKKASTSFSPLSMSTVWKPKFVSLSHGEFAYEDTNQQGSKCRKSIRLSVERCYCRAFKLGSPEGGAVFELTEFGGSRRLWQASSEQERDAWVTSIRTCMIGSVGDPFSQPSLMHPLGNDAFVAGSGLPSGGRAHLDTAAQVESSVEHREGIIPCSVAGAAAAYGSDIARYHGVQRAIHAATSREEFMEVISKMRACRTTITVPVFYVKNCNGGCPPASSIFGEKHMTTEQHKQAWKDMQRDTVRINGTYVDGAAHGADAVLGCFIREMMDQAKALKKLRALYKSVVSDPSVVAHQDVVGNDGTSSPLLTLENATESAMLNFVRDILALSNRTQSGGDSYLCANSLLVPGDCELCILTPANVAPTPVEIDVDIVEVHPTGDESRPCSLVKDLEINLDDAVGAVEPPEMVPQLSFSSVADDVMTEIASTVFSSSSQTSAPSAPRPQHHEKIRKKGQRKSFTYKPANGGSPVYQTTSKSKGTNTSTAASTDRTSRGPIRSPSQRSLSRSGNGASSPYSGSPKFRLNTRTGSGSSSSRRLSPSSPLTPPWTASSPAPKTPVQPNDPHHHHKRSPQIVFDLDEDGSVNLHTRESGHHRHGEPQDSQDTVAELSEPFTSPQHPGISHRYGNESFVDWSPSDSNLSNRHYNSDSQTSNGNKQTEVANVEHQKLRSIDRSRMLLTNLEGYPDIPSFIEIRNGGDDTSIFSELTLESKHTGSRQVQTPYDGRSIATNDLMQRTKQRPTSAELNELLSHAGLAMDDSELLKTDECAAGKPPKQRSTKLLKRLVRLVTPSRDKEKRSEIIFEDAPYPLPIGRSSDKEQLQSQLCLRVRIRSLSHFRLCDTNPQEEGDATWAQVGATFQRTFLLLDYGSYGCLLMASDRLVTVSMGNDLLSKGDK